ncbi:MAG: hypothetical protein EHM19_09905 [Candidatus Latescibacterota bacterium]|nr:MAG: hypothetical protein EHM19_09905 [Candidatus Latescibacterota bacterium]
MKRGLPYAALLLALAFAGAAAGGEIEKKIEAETGAPGSNPRALDCTGAIDVDCGAVVSGSNAGSPSNVSAYSCVSWNESGGEAVYRLVLAERQMLAAQLSDMTVDLDLFLLSACDAGACLLYGDAGFADCVDAGTYYFVVDGYNGAAGAFTLTISCALPPPIENETCELAIDLCGVGGEKDGPFHLSYSTSCASNDYDLPSGNACTGWTSSGNDLVYVVCLSPGGTLDVTQEGDYDMSLYLVTDCSDLSTCVAGSDNCCDGADETIFYASAAGGTYYLIVDGFNASGSGILHGEVTGCCETAVESGSWSGVKRIFR